MKKYIIWTPSLNLNSGGVTVLHRLAHIINQLGYESYLWPGDNNFEVFITNAKYDVSFASKELINDEAIIIYPEIVIGNPLNAKNVVRWILNKPGVLGGDGIFGKDDIIFYYSDAFTDGQKNVNYLQIMELYGDLFKDRHQARTGSCYLMGKGKGREIVHDTSDSIEITDTTPSENLVKFFNEKEFFYCYDNASFLSLQAALCGCISIVVPIEGVSAEEWIKMNKIRRYGISYGEENVEHAIMTMDKVRPFLESLDLEFIQNVKNFIIKTQDWANSKNMETKDSKTSIDYKFRKSETQIFEAEELIEKGEFILAKEILNKIINNSFTKVRVLNDLSIISILEKNYKEAEKNINEVLKLDEKNEIAQDNSEYLNETLLTTIKER